MAQAVFTSVAETEKDSFSIFGGIILIFYCIRSNNNHALLIHLISQNHYLSYLPDIFPDGI